MPTSSTSKSLYVHLEFSRGVAALIVLAGHLKAFLFVDYAQIRNPDLVDKLFYFITGLGHEAVMVFFVLSGFLISSSIENMVAGNYWSWKKYLINRLSRLWVVLIPALLLTLFWDSMGKELSASSYYLGELKALYNSGPLAVNKLSAYTFSTFMHNVLFLQTISAPSYGTNGPLWSLAYEFWYYIIFPLAYTLVAFRRNVLYSVICACLLLTVLVNMNSEILLGGLVWLIGYSVGLLHRRAFIKDVFSSRYYLFLALAIFSVSLFLARAGIVHGFYSDFSVGLAFGVLMMGMLNNVATNSLYIKLSDFFSNISYTLYLVHFPILGFICSVFLENSQSQPSSGLVKYVLLFAFVLLYAYTLYWLFERNTPRVRKYVTTIFNKPLLSSIK